MEPAADRRSDAIADAAARKRRRFRFSIPTLLLAATLCAILVGLGGTAILRWWSAHRARVLAAELAERGIDIVATPGMHGVTPRRNWLGQPTAGDPFPDLTHALVQNDEALLVLPQYSHQLANLEYLMLGGNVTDAGVAASENLRRFPNLDVVELLRAQVTDAGLEDLTRLTNPRWLYLISCGQITDAGLVHLKDLPRLEHLMLGMESGTSVPISDAGLVHIGKTTRLKSLSLIGLNVTDAGLAPLADLSNLEMLNLGGVPITDNGLKHVAGLPNLRRLAVRQTRVTDAGLQHLRGLTGLEMLVLNGPQVTDAGLVPLKSLANLRDLWLTGTNVTQKGNADLQDALPKCAILR